jgi:hypothetical protein
MPGVRQQAMQSAQAAQPVTQAQLQQALQQREPVMAAEGGLMQLPAHNMRFAEGGVIGYAEGGTPRTYGYAPDYEDARRMGINLSPYDSPEVRREKLERLQKMREFEASPDRGVAIPTEASQANEQALSQAFSPAAQQARMRDMPQRPAQSVSLPKAQPQRTGIAAVSPTRTQPRAEPSAPVEMLPDTRESTAVNPSEAALMYAKTQGAIKDLGERLSKPREESQQEKDYRAAMMGEYQRGLGSLASSEERFEKAKQERLASQQGRGLSDLASFLARAGGAGSLFGGLGKAQIGMEPILSARAQEEQKFREQELMFKDKLDERRGIVENLKLSTMRNDAEAQRAWANELRKNDAEMARLGITLGTERMKELSTGEREAAKTSAQAKEGELNRANTIEVERMRRATADRPGETERIFNKFNELKAKDPAAAEQYLQSIERIKGLGRGVEEKAEFARLRQQATMLQNELKAAMETDPLGKSPRIADLRAKLDGIYKQLGGESAPAAGKTMSMADVQATAKASGKTVDEVKKAAAAAGYTVQ